MADYSAQIANLLFSEDVEQLDTGFKDIDTKAGGLKRGTTTIIAGSTGMGKSLLALQILVNLAKQGYHSTYFELENGKRITWERLLRIWYKLTKSEFNALGNDQADLVTRISEIRKFISIWHTEDLLNFGWQKRGTQLLYDLIRVESTKSDIFLVDPLQALETRSRSDELYQEQGNIIKTLQELAEKKNVVIMITHHIRKGGNSYKQVKSIEDAVDNSYSVPTIDSLRGSGKIVDFAHSVWGMLRFKDSENEEERKHTIVKILKNREGMSGDYKIKFLEETLSFRDQSYITFMGNRV